MLMDMGSRMAGHCGKIITSFSEPVDRNVKISSVNSSHCCIVVRPPTPRRDIKWV